MNELGPKIRARPPCVIFSPEIIHNHGIIPGWAALFEWDQTALHLLLTWPRVPV
jgi:hypothetical protein